MNGSLAIITARGGSKRIPKKNIKPFLEQPIIQYSIDAAIDSGLFTEIMVSTDCREIADLSIKLGAKVPFFRSEKNSDDYAVTADVIEEVLKEYNKRGQNFTYACCIYPTAPFVTAEKLRIGYKLLRDNSADALVPVARFSYPIQRALTIKDGQLCMIWPEHEKSRSQDLETAYHDVGQFYWYRVTSFLKRNTMDTYKKIPFIVSEMEMHDLDNEEDWEIAELKYRYLKQT